MSRSPDQPERRVVLTDAAGIKALAHPARLTIIDDLYDHREERTATELADLVGLTASATSYHLRALERVGIVERGDTRGDGRERPWRAAADSVEVDSQHEGASLAAESMLLNKVLSRLQEDWMRWAGQHDEPEEWAKVATLAQTRIWLTPDEGLALVDSVNKLLDPYRNRDENGGRPAGARHVRTVWSLIPTTRMNHGKA
jgi:DNA-binding transcriptional ArsR family regulator